MSDGKSSWPPIITGGTLPFRIIFRDTILTLLMWTALIYGVVANLDVAWEAVNLMLGRPVAVSDKVLVPFLGRLERRLWIIAVLVTILGIATLVSRRRRMDALSRPQPEALTDDVMARNLGLSVQQLNDIRRRKLVALDIDSHGVVSLTTDQ